VFELAADEQAIVDVVAEFVDERVRPVVRDLEHADEYPEALIEQMKRLGVYGLLVPEEHGGSDVSAPCFALVTEQLARGWMSLAGAMGGHSVVAFLLREFGTDEQRRRYLPAMATGELRATMALTEPGGGSDLQAMRTHARRDGDSYVVDGVKTWISNARRARRLWTTRWPMPGSGRPSVCRSGGTSRSATTSPTWPPHCGRRGCSPGRGRHAAGGAPGGHGGGHGQALRLRDRDEGRPRRVAHPRRLWLLHGVRRRALLP
jgi:hypothetical protein